MTISVLSKSSFYVICPQDYLLSLNECWKASVRVYLSVWKGVCVCTSNKPVHLFIRAVSLPHESLTRTTVTCREERVSEEEKHKEAGKEGKKEV